MNYDIEDFKDYYDWLEPEHQKLIIDLVMQKPKEVIQYKYGWDAKALENQICFIINHWVQYNLQTLNMEAV